MSLPDQLLADETAILGAILAEPGVLDRTRLHLDGSEFWHPKLELLFAICCDLADAKVVPDATAVVAELGKRRKLETFRNGLDVFELIEHHSTAANLSWHMARLRESAKVRAVQRTAVRLQQQIDAHGVNGDTDQLLDHAAQASVALSLAVDAPELDAPVPGLMPWEDFVGPPDPSRWIVPGLIRRHDTIMLLGAAGVGKSVLSRLVAMCLAAGVHPFYQTSIKPVRTLLVDLENAPDQVAEEGDSLLMGVRRFGELEGRAMVWAHPEGLNLRKRADAMLLERVIDQAQPDVLCMGSLYNAYRRGSDDWDTAAEDVQGVLKGLRSKYNLGLWLEHHMPRQNGGGHTGTPFGGTMWERWPTHGRWLRRATGQPEGRSPLYLLEQTFRGDRGERDLPLGFLRGGRLPLTAIWDQAEIDDLMGEGS